MTNLWILQPLLAGLSVGVFCLTYCFPFMGSFLAAEERSLGKSTLVVMEFLLGRLTGYLCFGMIVGYLGEKFDSQWLRFATDISFIVLSVILLAYLFGLARKKEPGCPATGLWKKQSPFWMGLFMGINLCPPFLLSIAYVFSQKSTLYGLCYFALFFISSSVYFLPMIFVGLLSRTREFRTAARLSGFGVGIIFLVYGIYSIFHNI